MIFEGPTRMLTARDAATLSLLLRAGLATARREGWAFKPDQASLLADIDQLARTYRNALTRESDLVGPVGPRSEGSSASVWVDAATAGERLNISAHEVAKLIRAGRLSGRKVCGKWAIDIDGLNDEIERRTA